MSIQSNFPNLQPSLLLDFANTKQLDNRVTFTRSTPAVYYDGKTTALAEQNLTLQSQSIGNSPWSVEGVTFTTSSTAPDGTSTATAFTEQTNSGTHRTYQSQSYVSGSVYTISFYAKYVSRQYLQLNASGIKSGCRVIFDIQNGTVTDASTATTTSVISVGNSWYRCVTTITCDTASNTYSAPIGGNSSSTGNGESYTGNGSLAFYLWGYQTEARSTATAYTATTTQPITNYIPVLLSAGGNQPRFDCNPTTGESLGLLIEEQRTNIFPYSSEFNNAPWDKNTYVTISPNQTIAPDGTLTADKIIAGTTSFYQLVYQTITTSVQSYTLSVYAKAGEYAYLQILDDTSGLNFSSFNLATGAIVTLAAGHSASIISVGNGWYRCSVSFTGFSSGARSMYFGGGPDGTNAIFAGNGFNGIYIWGSQFEVGSFATSYIATTSASATRTADVAQISGTNLTSWYSQGNGTFYAEASTASVSGDVMILEGTNSTNAFLDVSMTFATTSTQFINRFTSLNSDMRKSGAVSANTMVKFSGSITSSLGTTVAATSGSTSTAVGSFTANFGADRMFIGSRGGSSLFLNAPIRKLAFYPAQLTQTQQNSITG